MTFNNSSFLSTGSSSFDKYPRLVTKTNTYGSSDLVNLRTFNNFNNIEYTAPQIALPNESFTVVGGWDSFERNPRFVGDVNNDGRDDIIGFNQTGVWTALSSSYGDGIFDFPELASSEFNGTGWSSFNEHPRLVGDFNGNGRDDIIGFDQSYIRTSFSNGDGTFSKTINYTPPEFEFLPNYIHIGEWSSFHAYPRFVGDVNNDGRDDIIGFGRSRVVTALSNGDGKFSQFRQSFLNNLTFNSGWTSFDKYPRAVGDINKDGMADIIGFGQAGVWTALSNGNGTFSNAKLSHRNFGIDQGWSSFDKYPRYLGNFDGKGNFLDIIGFGQNMVVTCLYNAPVPPM